MKTLAPFTKSDIGVPMADFKQSFADTLHKGDAAIALQRNIVNYANEFQVGTNDKKVGKALGKLIDNVSQPLEAATQPTKVSPVAMRPEAAATPAQAAKKAPTLKL